MPLAYGVDFDCDTMRAVMPSAASERAVPKTRLLIIINWLAWLLKSFLTVVTVTLKGEAANT